MEVKNTTGSQFPHVDRVMDRIVSSKDTSWLKALGYVFLLMGAGIIDFPGVVTKAGKDIKNRLKKAPSA